MEELILILLISFILSLSTTNKQLFELPIYGSYSYSGNNPSLSVLNISEFKEDIIIISYYIEHNGFKTEELKYEFTDKYPDVNFNCKDIKQKSYSKLTKSGTKRNSKIKTVDYFFEIKNQNKRFLVLENLLYPDYVIEVTHHKKDSLALIIIIVVIFFLLFFGVMGFAIYCIIKTNRNKKSNTIDFQKEEPVAPYPPNQPYDSKQNNDIPIQQLPYSPQLIPPEVENSNETGYSSGINQQNGSSGTGEQRYYS
jgi:hypothetical protein